MVEKTPQQAAAVEKLRAWAIGPEGQKHFKWGTSGDFKRCESFYKGKMPAFMIPGWCAKLHKRATGATPGNAPGEKKAGGGGKAFPGAAKPFGSKD